MVNKFSKVYFLETDDNQMEILKMARECLGIVKSINKFSYNTDETFINIFLNSDLSYEEFINFATDIYGLIDVNLKIHYKNKDSSIKYCYNPNKIILSFIDDH